MSRPAGAFARPRVAALVVSLAAANLGYAAMLIWGAYVAPDPAAFAASGLPVPDFAALWAAGRMTLDGAPAAAYDWAAHRAVEVEGLGHDFAGLMPWHYPPPLQLALAPLGALPLWGAMALWGGATLALYLWACWRILPDRLTLAGALAAAPTAFIATNGQTGFLLAWGLGFALIELEKRPVRAGILFGLLALKPHLLAAIPLPLAADGRWRVIAAGAATVAGLVLASLAALGTEPWAAFFGSLAQTGEVFQGDAGRFVMYASAYGGLRHIGAGFAPALALHGALALATLAALVTAFRDARTAPDLKAALLCFGAAAATPRIFNYDLHILVIGGLFQVRHALAAGFAPGERAVLAFALGAAFASMLFAPGVAWGLALLLFWTCWLGARRRSRPAGENRGLDLPAG